MSNTALDSLRQDRPLAESIAIATRSIHAKLNKLILARLPLALPPQAADPFVYSSGLLHIAPIYMTFESLWKDILDDSSKREKGKGNENATIEDLGHCAKDTTEIQRQDVSEHLQELLSKLYLPGLMRSENLTADVQSMTGWTEKETKDQLSIISKTGHLAEFVNHIKRAATKKPHVLLAYSYIMFMALFAGGRYIRATLESAGKEFWTQSLSASHPYETKDKMLDATEPNLSTKQFGTDTDKLTQISHDLPLRFFHFDTPLDGEDLKQAFKQHLADAEKQLSYQEKHDIVQEAICIFENMILVVTQLDKVMARSLPHDSTPVDRTSSVDSVATVIKRPFSLGRFRDSVMVTKERSARGSSNRLSSLSSSSSHSSNCEADDKTTPVMDVSKSENDPILLPASSVSDLELCPGMSKSMRFEKTLPHPSRGHDNGQGRGQGQLHPDAGKSKPTLVQNWGKMVSKHLAREQLTNWVFGVAIGLIVLGVMCSGRSAASLA